MRLRHAHRDAAVQKKHQQKMAPMDNPYPINAIVAPLHAEKETLAVVAHAQTQIMTKTIVEIAEYHVYFLLDSAAMANAAHKKVAAPSME